MIPVSGTTNVITAMKEKGVSRVAVVTSIGTGDSEKQAPFFFKVRRKIFVITYELVTQGRFMQKPLCTREKTFIHS